MSPKSKKEYFKTVWLGKAVLEGRLGKWAMIGDIAPDTGRFEKQKGL